MSDAHPCNREAKSLIDHTPTLNFNLSLLDPMFKTFFKQYSNFFTIQKRASFS